MQSARVYVRHIRLTSNVDLAHTQQDLKERLICACGHIATIFDLLERMKNEGTMMLKCPVCRKDMVRLSINVYTEGLSGSL